MKSSLKIILILLVISAPLFGQQVTKKLFVASWNVENLFDTFDDKDKRDDEFLPEGRKEWTEKRLETKYKNLAKVIRFMNDGNGPDILGVQEVEHKALLKKLFKKHISEKNYKIAYAESPDKRGIDNALIYDADLFSFIAQKELEVVLPDKYPTRLILWVKLKYEDEILNVFVNHWPSRRGGEEKSEPNRIAAAKTLKKAVEMIKKDSPEENIIIMGDFNDEPENNSIYKVLGADNSDYLVNLSFSAYKNGLGTYRYRGDWNMLDQIIINKLLLEGNFRTTQASFNVLKPDFTVQKEGRYKGTSFPTYGGRKYLGGYSDHYPVGIVLTYTK
ncbi:MAG: endonuclease/exonuclease/phosphatase family protein [Rhodothermaceae bacterium]